MLTRKTLSLTDCSIKFRQDDDKKPGCKFSGYASVFNGIDSYGDTILPGAYDNVIATIRDGSARMPKMFVNHKAWDLPIGKWVSMAEDDMGLKVDGELTAGNPAADGVRASLIHGTLDGLSIGFRLEDGDTETIEQGEQKIRLIKNISELVEISLVTFPADEEARIDLASVKNALDQVKTIRDFESFLRDAGLPKSVATAAASQAKRLFQRESELALNMPPELRQLIVANLIESKQI